MKHLKTLVLLQLRDKIDLSWLKDKSSSIRTLILFFLKFIIVSGITYLILFLCTRFSIFYYSESVRVMILVLSFSIILSLISCTVELMKNLYFSEDNKVLITLPVNANSIFISKIIVYYVYEVKRSFGFLIPITLGCCLNLVLINSCSPIVFLYMWIPIFFIISLPVLVGALLSIPTMYIYRFLKKYSIIEVIVFISILTLLTWGVISLINLLPTTIDLNDQWTTIGNFIRGFLLSVEEYLFMFSHLVRVIIGEKQANQVYLLEWFSLVKLLILIVTNVGLFFIVYFASRPLFFSMMAKNFETNKSKDIEKKNIKRNKYITFINKEFVINLRTIDISINYLMVYIIIPVLIFLLNKLYSAMDTNAFGNLLICTFNILLICLPLLASNSLVATYYSREGRAGYMKKAKPVFAAYPLLAKLFFNMVFSIPSVFITTSIFGYFAHNFYFVDSGLNLGMTEIVILGFALLFLHYGHMLLSAMMDIMNPQNEQYATTGTDIDNPNETKSTIIAFIFSFVYAIICYKLLDESSLYSNGLTLGMVKLLLISLLILISVSFLFAKRIKAYYYDMQGR